MDLETLRLARAKALCALDHGWGCDSRRSNAYWGRLLALSRDKGSPVYLLQHYLDRARAIEPSDAALGVVSVPEYPTQEIADAFFSGQTKRDTDIELPVWLGDFGNFAASWSDAVAASPLREKSDEQ